MALYWMQDQHIPTCLFTNGQSVMSSKARHLSSRLDSAQLLIKVKESSDLWKKYFLNKFKSVVCVTDFC